MLFNSLDFAIFLPIVFILYWYLNNRDVKYQNLLIVFASYVFYGWWDWRFLLLIVISTIIDYTVGNRLRSEEGEGKRKALLWISILANLGFLGFFKYYNFFLDNFVEAFSFLGMEIQANSLNIILPVGISFYTFQTLSYTIDVYRRKLEPTKDFIAFSAFVSFFPQLVAGPIERATHLLPQFYKKRTFDYLQSVDGLRQILWGLFKKIVIADNCAEFANMIFNNSEAYSGSTLVLGALFFTFQIYGDFSGYSDIAIGTSRLFGFDLMRNFNFPYFSRDIAEFWRRWHISLSTWFRDYLYIPLGGSRGGLMMKIRNTFIIFIVSGFWHGANWTFIIWGTLNAIYFLPVLLTENNRNNIEIVAKGKVLPTLKEFFLMLITFSLVVFAWIFFRANNVEHAISYISEILSFSFFTFPDFENINRASMVLLLVGVFLLFEWHGREWQFAIAKLGLTWKRPIRYILYYSLIIAILWFGGKEQEFIYFQF
ncbi:MBOAT family O-acyltransferase [Marivirga harenae]|uniref:MBOAT family O-acyltransferase n=1 Tax=Marivirga harenae TaxID=2010992 RepID=UPI0026DFA0C1|nr:MBOAT family O-acyltransferase [Marivirga harenae]WKV12880.1 MBOAT family O-acyltransferase [Marivirga harenae]|tara:strand:- start:6556 stop:8004 length:1449 start_codon:yes stop_codon:yes gene_type:complete